MIVGIERLNSWVTKYPLTGSFCLDSRLYFFSCVCQICIYFTLDALICPFSLKIVHIKCVCACRRAFISPHTFRFLIFIDAFAENHSFYTCMYTCARSFSFYGLAYALAGRRSFEAIDSMLRSPTESRKQPDIKNDKNGRQHLKYILRVN